MSQYCDAHGNTVDADEALDSRGILRNGYGLRTPLYLMDSTQRDIAEHAGDKRRRMTRGGYMGDAATGFVDDRGVAFAPDPRAIAARDALDHMQGRDEMLRQMYRDGRAAAEQARQEMLDAMSNAWRGDARAGDDRSADAAPALPPRIMSMGEAQRIKREAYEQWCAMGRTLGAEEVSNVREPRKSDRGRARRRSCHVLGGIRATRGNRRCDYLRRSHS